MRKPERFHLLLVYGDGTRVLRLSILRWILYGGLLLMLLGASAFGAIVTDYLIVRQRWSRVAALRQQAAERQVLLEQRVAQRQALIDTSRRRIAEVRDVIVSWRDLHARIWVPFGPQPNTAREESGIGGSAVRERLEAPDLRVGLAEELDSLVRNVNEAGENLRSLDGLLSKAGKVLAVLPSRWPVLGTVKSEFGQRRSPWTGAREFHGGLDISVKPGTPVNAPGPGKVTFAGRRGDYGNVVILDHGHAIRTVYAHLGRVKVRAGQQVKRGQVIALSGNTGRSTGPHLHYEIVVRGKPVDPRGYLWD